MIPDPQPGSGLPLAGSALLVRTDFSDDEAWAEVRREAVASWDPEDYGPTVVDDRRYATSSWTGIREAAPTTSVGPVVALVADRASMTAPGHPLMVVGLGPYQEEEPLRCEAAVVAGVVGDLEIGNVDWFELEDQAARTGGVIRG